METTAIDKKLKVKSILLAEELRLAIGEFERIIGATAAYPVTAKLLAAREALKGYADA
jgi:hypothetical protein